MRLMVLHSIWAQQVANKLIGRGIPFECSEPRGQWYTFEVGSVHAQDLNEISVTVPADYIN